MVAGPLLLATLSDNPALIAGGAFAAQLPWLLFALLSGAFVDRLDRHRLLVTVNLLRGAILTVVALAVATGTASVPLVYASWFLLGIGETLADTAYGALLPSVVPPENLERANARLSATFTVANQFAAKPLGAWLYGTAAAIPFGLDAASFVAAAALITTLSARSRSATPPIPSPHYRAPLPPTSNPSPPDCNPRTPAAPRDQLADQDPAAPNGSRPSAPTTDRAPLPVHNPPAHRTPSTTSPETTPSADSNPAAPEPVRGLRADIAEGLRWLWQHRLLRVLTLAMGVANVAFCAAFAVFVLYARDRLGLSDIGYGFLLTTFAVGGLAGAGLATRLSHRFGTATVLRAGLIVEALTHLTLAITTNPLVAGGAIVIFGVHTTVWGVLASSIRQRIVPDRLRGRVGSVHALLETGGAALGWLLGAVLTQFWGITTPFWLAASAMVTVAIAAWHPLAATTPRSPHKTSLPDPGPPPIPAHDPGP
ncbi:MFS transporter [Actinoplanes awajinensis]